jgi:hypothetical protein
MTIVDTTTVSVLFALIALAVLTGVVATGIAVIRTYGIHVHLPRHEAPVLHGRFAH